MQNRFAAVVLATSLAAPAIASASTWDIDSGHSSATFTVRHLAVSNVRGEFGKVTGVINLDDKDITRSTVEASIDASAVNTRNADRDNHLKSPDFFDVARFPAISFKSRKVSKSGKHLRVTGDLTIRGVTREAVLDVEDNGVQKDPWGNTKAGFTATTEISRKHWGLEWNVALDTGGVLVGDKVKIELEIQAAKA
jgi:polyisoprenoid-binding protein YceI